jgi:hypothetical protein
MTETNKRGQLVCGQENISRPGTYCQTVISANSPCHWHGTLPDPVLEEEPQGPPDMWAPLSYRSLVRNSEEAAQALAGNGMTGGEPQDHPATKQLDGWPRVGTRSRQRLPDSYWEQRGAGVTWTS